MAWPMEEASGFSVVIWGLFSEISMPEVSSSPNMAAYFRIFSIPSSGEYVPFSSIESRWPMSAKNTLQEFMIPCSASRGQCWPG